MNESGVSIRAVDSRDSDDLAAVRELWREYGEHLQMLLGSAHVCMQGLEAELMLLPAGYAAPGGSLLLARINQLAVGCVGLHTIQTVQNAQVCEMRRMWVTPKYRHCGVGKALLRAAIQQARKLGYAELYLDTVIDKMPDAVRLYRQAGFQECERYNTNSVPGLAFFRKTVV